MTVVEKETRSLGNFKFESFRRELELPLYDKIVLLIRNPLEAALAEYNRYQSGQVQSAIVEVEDFEVEQWRMFVKSTVLEWAKFHEDIMSNFDGKIHFVRIKLTLNLMRNCMN